MKKFLLQLLLLAGAILPASAQQRTESEAQAIAQAFMKNNGYEFNITKSAKINKVRTAKGGDITPYYIFNDTRNGGFVIVGGQEGMSDILAYSDDECFDTNDIPPAAQFWLDTYAESAKKAADDPEAAMAEKKAAAKAFKASNFSKRMHVAPLLGEINYAQGTPYNCQCPLLDVYSSTSALGYKQSRSIVGCTSTALGSIMRYWKWPMHSRGTKTHTFEYSFSSSETRSMTLTVDYDSTGLYDWDNMLPTYKSGVTYSEEEANAVGKLLYHIGVSLQAKYGTGATSASLRAEVLPTYFGYASDYIGDAKSNYKNDIEFITMMADELSQGRPIWAAGSGSNAAHSYVCDGFDMNGLFHFNLGWNGGSNGYYEIAPTPNVPYGNGMYFFRHIHPQGRLTPVAPTRRVVIEAGLGDWNSKSNSIIGAFNTLDKTGKFGESMITIVTADEVSNAEEHLKGLGKTEGIILDRCEKLTTINTTQVTNSYLARYKVDAPAKIDVEAGYASDSSMLVTVYTQFPESHTGADYRLAFVYTESEVDVNGLKYNNLARGTYPNNEGYENSIPSEIEYDAEYKFVKEIPFPSTIENSSKATLVALLLDGKTRHILNANTISIDQIDRWREKQKPAFNYEGAQLKDSSAIYVYDFDEEKSRMAFPIRINNPLYERMPVDIIVEEIATGSNASFQIGENNEVANFSYSLLPNCVDSTQMIYLNISDKALNSESSIKLTLKYKNQVIAKQLVNFNYIKSVEGLNAYTVRIKGQLEELMANSLKDTITHLTIGGRISGKDIAFIRDSLNLKSIDLSQARIVEGPGEYYNDYTTQDDIVGVRMFNSMKMQTIILPNSAKTIDNYAIYQNKKLTKVAIGNTTETIGSYTFSGCSALERITIPASVKEIGRQAFKECPVVCVICESETPASAASKAFDSSATANATLVVPTEAAIAAYKAASVWKTFGNIISYDQYLTNITPATETVAVTVKDGRIIVEEDAEVAIYTFAGKFVTKGGAGEYALPAGNYIVKVGNKAVKVKL